jgi:DNA helicase-4
LDTINTYGTHWIGTWFGHPWLDAGVTATGIILNSETEPVFLAWSELAEVPQLSLGIIFDAVILKVQDATLRIDWLAGERANAFKVEVELGWYGYHAGTANTEVARLQQMLNQPRYLRTSRWQRIRDEAAKALSLFASLPPEGVVCERVRAPFVQLREWADWDAASIQPFRDRYVQQQKAQYKMLLDSIESNPLTQNQRDACIIDEDHNLVLAGAGTGKTSTMVGRAAYLIQSGQARASEVLLLAYGNKAAKEMRERLAQRLTGDSVKAKTFHALGQEIIARVEGSKSTISPLVEDAKRLAKQVDTWFDALLEEPTYRRLAVQYFEKHLHPEKNPFDFKSLGEYYQYLAANEIRTLKGEEVKSFEECLIANWLFRMGVEYEYEHPYRDAQTRNLGFRTYLPDFYLPEYGIYIEHLGIDRNGDTAPYVDRDKYQADLRWKRALHQNHKTSLLETYHYEQREGCLLENLYDKLVRLKVAFDPLPDEAVLETLREVGAVSRFAELLSQFLSRYKACWFDEVRLRQQIACASDPSQVEAALLLLEPVFDRYQDLLAAREEIDFDDMIGQALGYVQEGAFKPHWKFILVDEFQDISEPRARLIKALQVASADCSLFCVGDDWQAIYRFSGSDVSLTSGFGPYFGATVTTTLDKTFRFNNSICDIASQFVMKNPAQVKKQLTTYSAVNLPAVSLLRQSRDRSEPLKLFHSILTAIARQATPGSSVYLLARFWFRLPDKSELAVLNQDYSSLNIEALSIHASKGREADYVVIVGLEDGKQGFPSEKVTHPLLEALLPAAESYPHAEERRLFYVALTRARHRVYLACDMAVASKFVVELIDAGYPIEKNEFETSLVQTLFVTINCLRCETGSLVPRSGKFGVFFGCSHYPLCNHAEKGCQRCGQAMKREGRFKRCLDDGCGHWSPVCPDCGAEMLLRTGTRGQFWGCKNFRGDDAPSCRHTENVINGPSPSMVLH